MKLSIVIPAHNEENRIGNTLWHYSEFYREVKRNNEITTELLVVLNGCTDNTLAVVKEMQQKCKDVAIYIVDIAQSGKGIALTEGFKNALTRDNDLIGFVDADMATSPKSFYELVEQRGNADGIIASRYMSGAQVTPPRPFIKRYGSKLIYEPLVWLLFGMHYYDYQCGAKLFTRAVIEKIVHDLTVQQWAFDVELLYLCKKYGFTIKEIPTIWHDQKNSKLKMIPAGFRMLYALLVVRFRHVFNK